MSVYQAAAGRYREMTYARAGESGLQLPAISLGLWQNFGSVNSYDNSRRMILYAFDRGITYFDLANNYGPAPGSAEETMGRVLRDDLAPYRDELIISTKAGFTMWDGPYGDGGSRKYLTASLDQSLKRMGLVYVDIFYSHRYDPDTPLEETMGALADAVRAGKALYAGLSNYPAEQTRRAVALLKERGVRCLLHQPCYNLFDRRPEREGVWEALEEARMGAAVYSPLAQGLLTGRYLDGVPSDSRAGRGWTLHGSDITPDRLRQIRALNELAAVRGQSLAQMALAWDLRQAPVTTVIVGSSSVEQLADNLGALENRTFMAEELSVIDRILEGR